jgi:hypothetical protein
MNAKGCQRRSRLLSAVHVREMSLDARKLSRSPLGMVGEETSEKSKLIHQDRTEA